MIGGAENDGHENAGAGHEIARHKIQRAISGCCYFLRHKHSKHYA